MALPKKYHVDHKSSINMSIEKLAYGRWIPLDVEKSK